MAGAPLCLAGQTATRLGLGTWALGGGADWGAQDRAQAEAAVRAALDGGVNWIDTSPIYGWGAAEELLGRVLHGRRQEVLLADKCGIVLNAGRPDHCLTAASVVAECEASLKRLRTDYLDLYQIHWPDPKTPLEETWQALQQLQKQGKIRAVGVCNFSAGPLRQAVALGPVAGLQMPVSLLRPLPDEIQAVCLQKQIPLVAYGALGGGILSGKYPKEPNFRRRDARRYFYPYYFAEGFTAAQAVAARVRELAAQKNVAPAAVALAWSLACPGVSGVLVGARSATQVQQNLQALRLTLTPQEQEFLHGGN